MQYVSVFFFAIVRRPTKPVWVAKEGTSALRENVGESVVDEGLTQVERKGQRSVQRPVLGKKCKSLNGIDEEGSSKPNGGDLDMVDNSILVLGERGQGGMPPLCENAPDLCM